VLGVQAGLTCVANEVVVLMMVGGAADSSSWSGLMSTDLCQPSLGWPGRCPHTSNRVLITVVT
jgi:hypothetical protein